MKNVLLMVIIGIGLFLGAMVGLLAAQGRLTYEGTRSIPILNRLFEKPAEDPANKGKEDNADATGGKGNGGDQEAPDSGFGTQAQRPLPYRREDLSGNDGSDPGSAGSNSKPLVTRKPEQPKRRDPNRKPTKEEREWAMRRNQVENQHPYSRGLFDFKTIKADITLREFNDMVRQVQKKQQQQAEMDATLNKKRRDLETQMDDVLYRQQEVAKQMQQVVLERDKLDGRIEEFHKKVLLVKQDELEGLKENARNIANLDAETGRDLILSWWNQGPAGEARAIKTLSVMTREAVESIMETMETDRLREILDKRLTLARTKKGGGDK
jgi:hypothetical protein